MISLKKWLSTSLLALTFTTSFASKAGIIELALILDGSGSMGTSGYASQLDAYKTIFNDDFYTNNVVGGDQLYVSVYQFSRTVVQEVSATLINDDASAAAFGDLFNTTEMSYLSSYTDTALAVNTAVNDLLNNDIVSDNMIIDVSTDGNPYNRGGSVVARQEAISAASNASSSGITVNAIGIGQNIDVSFLDQFSTAGNGFYKLAPTFDDFEASLREKLHREINSVSVPEPSVIAFFLSGFALVSLRKRNS